MKSPAFQVLSAGNMPQRQVQNRTLAPRENQSSFKKDWDRAKNESFAIGEEKSLVSKDRGRKDKANLYAYTITMAHEEALTKEWDPRIPIFFLLSCRAFESHWRGRMND